MKKMMLAILMVFLFMPIVYSQSTTITVEDPVYDSTTADVGASRTVSVTLKSSSGSVTASVALVTAVESGTGTLTAATDTGKAQYDSVSITSGGVTKTFTVSASSAGTYSFYVKATTSDGSGAQSSMGYLEYVNPSSFTMTINEDPSGTLASGSTVGVVITFHNHLSTQQTRNITLWFSNPSTTGSGDPFSRLVTLQGGESSKLIWNITPVYASPSYAYVRLGDNEQSTTFSFNEPSGDGDGTTGGGGGDGVAGAGAAGETTTTVTATTAPGTTVSPEETTIPGEATTTTPLEIPMEVAGIPTWIIGAIIIMVVIAVGVIWKFRPREHITSMLREF